MGGLTVPAVLGDGRGPRRHCRSRSCPLYFELDGTFPNHEANPLEPANLVDLQQAVVEHGADLGLAFDGDADRCFVVDEQGGAVNPSAVAAIVALREIARVRAAGEERRRRHPQPDHLALRARDDRGGRRHAGAHARRPLAHQGPDDGDRRRLRRRALGALLLPRLLGRRQRHARRDARAGRVRRPARAALGARGAVHALLAVGRDQLDRRRRAGRLHAHRRGVHRPRRVRRVRRPHGHGITAESEPFWWFNVRPSNTEPLLRLNVEGGDAAHDGRASATRCSRSSAA